MQQDVNAAGSGLPVFILGVNYIGHESGNASITSGRDLPWLQDTPEAMAIESWAPVYRDVVIVDADNVKVGVYNLTEHDLSVPENYATLKGMLLDAAAAP